MTIWGQFYFNIYSFEAADINTIISIIHAPVKKINGDHLVKFVAFKKPFEEAVFTEYLLQIEETKEVVSNDIFRAYPITVKDLNEAGTEYENETQQKMKIGTYVGNKWGGKYLRAPDIFFTILRKGKDKLVKLGDIAEVRRGFTTGANEFFYLTDAKVREWGIEKEFLKPVIKSPRECKKLLVNPKDLKYRIFICNKSKEELKGTNALKYIEWGENVSVTIKRGSGKGEAVNGFNSLETIKNRKTWYSLCEWRKAFSVLPMFERERKYCFWNQNGAMIDNALYGVYCDKKELNIVLNSSIFHLFKELMARPPEGGGGGPLQIKVYHYNEMLVVHFNNLNLKIGQELFTTFIKREIKSTFEESGIDPKSKIPIEEQEPKPLPDRAELDKIVFDALGLTADERKDVYRAVCRLVWNRISKAKSV